MSPSKENCLRAIAAMADWPDSAPMGGDAQALSDKGKKLVMEFLEAAHKRLPTQAALDKDKSRTKTKK